MPVPAARLGKDREGSGWTLIMMGILMMQVS